jgi:mRNA interferase HigB
VRIFSRRTLREFWEAPGHEDAEGPLRAWFAEASKARWTSPADVKGHHASASILKNGRVVFNIGGNKYRLVVAIRYDGQLLFVRFVGTHREYDAINANEV